MPRPQLCRRIDFPPDCRFFAPRTASKGAIKCAAETVFLRLDELEAMRLVDLEGLYQEEAAKKLGVSRQTLGNILESARKKVTDTLVNGKSLNIGGGSCHRNALETRRCPRCRKRRIFNRMKKGEPK
jgi:uncharacterized protein